MLISATSTIGQAQNTGRSTFSPSKRHVVKEDQVLGLALRKQNFANQIDKEHPVYRTVTSILPQLDDHIGQVKVPES